MKNENPYSTADVAEMLGVSRTAVLGYIKRGRLKASRQGRDWQISREDFDEFARLPRQPGFPKGMKRNRRAASDEEIARNLVGQAVGSLVRAKLFALSTPETDAAIEKALKSLMPLVA
jgi:excisionase family DNA binding protein